MAAPLQKTIRKITASFTHPDVGVTYPSWAVVDLTGALGLGVQGRVVRSVIRMDASGTTTSVDLRLINGDYALGSNPSINPLATAAHAALVPDEDVAFETTAVTVSGSATDADEDLNVELDAAGAFYTLGREQNGALLLGLRFIAGSAGASVVNVTLYVDDRA